MCAITAAKVLLQLRGVAPRFNLPAKELPSTRKDPKKVGTSNAFCRLTMIGLQIEIGGERDPVLVTNRRVNEKENALWKIIS